VVGFSGIIKAGVRRKYARRVASLLHELMGNETPDNYRIDSLAKLQRCLAMNKRRIDVSMGGGLDAAYRGWD
jgi:hypothetical protein